MSRDALNFKRDAENDVSNTRKQADSIEHCDSANDPDAPDRVAMRAIQWQPFPVDLLPASVARFVVETSDAVCCDPSMLALPALATMAAAIGMSREVIIKKSWREPPVLWTCVVARSGSRKSPAHDKATERLCRLQSEAFKAYESELEQFKKDLNTFDNLDKKQKGKAEKPTEPQPFRYIIDDCTIEAVAPILKYNPRGVLLARDELSGWFRSFGEYKANKGSDLSNWLQINRAGKLTVDRKTNQRIIHVDRAAVSICGTIQPSVLSSILTPEFFESGLTARILFANPPKRRLDLNDSDISNAAMEGYTNTINELAKIEPIYHVEGDVGYVEPMGIPLSAEARELFNAFRISIDNRAAEAPSDSDAAMLSKMEAYAARFALIFTLADAPQATIVEAEAIQRGIDLAEWFINEALRMYTQFAMNEEDAAIKQVIDKIAQWGGRVTANNLRKRSSQFATSESARVFLDRMVELNHGRWEEAASGRTGGRPTQTFVLFDTQNHNPIPPKPHRSPERETDSEQLRGVMVVSDIGPDHENVTEANGFLEDRTSSGPEPDDDNEPF